jgi:hypothetical protein
MPGPGRTDTGVQTRRFLARACRRPLHPSVRGIREARRCWTPIHTHKRFVAPTRVVFAGCLREREGQR